METLKKRPRVTYKPVDDPSIPIRLASREHGEVVLKPKDLHEAVDFTIRPAQFDEDTEESLREQASDAYDQALKDNPELGSNPTKRARVKFVRRYLGFDYDRLAALLGITANQVRRQDLRARRKNEIGKFDERLNNAVAITSIFQKEFDYYAGAVVERRAAMHLPNGKLGDLLSIFEAMKAGFGNIAVSIALETVRLNQEVYSYQPKAQRYTP